MNKDIKLSDIEAKINQLKSDVISHVILSPQQEWTVACNSSAKQGRCSNQLSNDSMTLRSIVQWICSLKSDSENNQFTASDFFTSFTAGVYTSIKLPANKWQKLYSGEFPSSKTLEQMFEIFTDDSKIKLLKNNISQIIAGLDINARLESIQNRMHQQLRFYSANEIYELDSAFDVAKRTGQCVDVLFLMLKHGCDHIELSSSIAGEQLADMAAGSEYDSIAWRSALRLSAELGYPKAAHDVGKMITKWSTLSDPMSPEAQQRISTALSLYVKNASYLPCLFEVAWLLSNHYVKYSAELRRNLNISKKTNSLMRWKREYDYFNEFRKNIIKTDQLAWDIAFYLVDKGYYKAVNIIVDILQDYGSIWNDSDVANDYVESITDTLLREGAAHNETRCMVVLTTRLAKRICAYEGSLSEDSIKQDIDLFWELSNICDPLYLDEGTSTAVIPFWQAIVLEKTSPGEASRIIEFYKSAWIRVEYFIKKAHAENSNSGEANPHELSNNEELQKLQEIRYQCLEKVAAEFWN